MSPTASTTFSGAIQGSVSLAVSGAGMQVLAGNNTYTGGTTVNSGILELARTASLPGYGTSGSVTVAAGGVLAVQGNPNGTSGWSNSQIDTLAAKTTWSSATSALGIDTAQGDFTYGSNLSQALSLTKLGPNTLTLTGSNSYTGQTTVSAGTLQLGDGTVGHDGSIAGSIVNNSALVYNLNGNQTYGGVISGAGNVTKAGTGTLTLTGVSSYTGMTTINQGTLQMQAVSVMGNMPANFNSLGTTVNGYQDFFQGTTLNSGWVADEPSLWSVSNGALHFNGTESSGAGINRLYYKPAGLAASTNWDILALITINSASGGSPRIGAFAGGTPGNPPNTTAANVLLWSDNFGSTPGYLLDGVSWGPAFPGTTSLSTPYWVDLNENNGAVSAQVWPADGATSQNSATPVTWLGSNFAQYITGWAGISGPVSKSTANFNVNYVLIQNSSLPSITVGQQTYPCALPYTTTVSIASGRNLGP